MLQIKSSSKDVYVAYEAFPSVGRPELEFLKSRIKESARGRVRLCAHKTNDDRLHEMFIGFAGATYLKPSKHMGKDESLHVLEGSGDYVFFDDVGRLTEVISLGAYSSDFQFYCRIPDSVNHALVIRSGPMLIHETTSGPFNRADTVFASWAPEESETSKVSRYITSISPREPRQRPMLRMNRINAEVYVADDPIVSVGRKEMDFLKSKVHESERKRVRLCAHKVTEAGLHEMFVVYMSQTYVRPNKHLNKDESLHILEGEADFYFFDEHGNVAEIIRLGDYHSGRQFYCRVPAFFWHTIVMRSETLVIHETTPGPFRRADTVWAPWAPEEGDTAAIDKFIDRLRFASEDLKDLKTNP